MKKALLIIGLIITSIGFSQTPITATIPYQGYDETQAYLGQAEYQLFIDTTNGVLDKPIIIVDGFDPTDTRDINGMYSALDYDGNNIADQLRSEDFDFVFLNFPVYTRASDQIEIDGGSDYIQRNAMILVALINQINTQKIGAEKLVVVGPSMGGLISRYALKYMEDNSLNHDTRLYISWDSPHKGANLPINMQYLMNYLAEANGGNQDLKDQINATLNSPSAKEMLIDHYAAHLQSGEAYEQDPALLLPEGAVNFRNTFQTELDALGFPTQTRNICVANGSGLGEMTGTPGMEILNHTFNIPNSGGSTIDIELHFAPPANQTIEVTKTTIDIPIFPDIVYTANAESFTYTDGVDSAPGGKYDIQSFLGGVQGNAMLTELIANLQQSAFCFIPTISALAITNENNWYANTDLGNTHNSDFDAWYIPDTNEDHVTPTAANVAFILPEIRNQVAGINNELTNAFKLKSNLVKNNITIIANNNSVFNVVIYNSNGQIVNKRIITNHANEIQIPIALENGMYFIALKDNLHQVIKKFVVSK